LSQQCNAVTEDESFQYMDRPSSESLFELVCICMMLELFWNELYTSWTLRVSLFLLLSCTSIPLLRFGVMTLQWRASISYFKSSTFSFSFPQKLFTLTPFSVKIVIIDSLFNPQIINPFSASPCFVFTV